MIELLLWIIIAFYGAGAASSFLAHSGKRGQKEVRYQVLFLAGVLVNAFVVGHRWVVSGRAPMVSLYELLIFLALCVMAMHLLLEKSTGLAWLGVVSGLLGCVCIALSFLAPSDVEPLMPALQSDWLAAHVLLCFVGYAAFALSFVTALGYIVLEKYTKTNPDVLRMLDIITYRFIAVGFPFLTAGVITGAVWANSAWGKYWGWDPKETWSLVTWLVYAVYLHARFTSGWKGKRTAWLAVIGFAAVLITWFGVNYLSVFTGLHSYA